MRVFTGFFILFIIIFLVACDEKAEPDYMDPHIAQELLSIEFNKPNNMFDREGVIITLIYVDSETETMVVGLLKSNRKTKKKIRDLLINEIIKQDVRLKIIQSDISKVQ